jgi:salicylate hydroxylase
MARTPKVAIIGGGIGGLSAALAMQQRGFEVEVYEQSPELSEIGAGLNLSPNALKAFRALGVEDAATSIGFEPDFQLIRSWRSGRIIFRQPRKGALEARFGAGHLTVHRADLLEVLSRPLPERIFRLGARCTAVIPGVKSAAARFADGSEIEADVIVGADGIRSVVRESLFGPEAPRFTGCVCWRGLVPMDKVPRGLISGDSTMYMGPHGHVVHYLVRRGELVNFVAHYDSDAWTEESWTRECDRSELMQTYAGWHDTLLRLYECADRYYKWALYDRDPPERWSKGRATLLGDSAHAMLPYLGQGACMAIEDGYMLAATMARTPDDLDAALALYEQVRVPRTRRTVLGSRERARVNHLASPWARLKRNAAFAARRLFDRDSTAFQADWLYSYDVAAEARFAEQARRVA